MSASITLSALSWSTPDRTPVLSGLDLSFGPVRTGLVGRNGTGKTTLLKLVAGELTPDSGSLHVSGSVGMLRQRLREGDGETVAGLFGVEEALALLRRAEQGRADADELADADWTLESRMQAALARVGLDVAPHVALAELSGGQRTRARLAALVFGEPDILLLDEPTNNLDREGRAAVADLLSGWRGGAIVVSHDRELLRVMDAIVELTSLGARQYGGNWDHYSETKALELEAARHGLAVAERQVAEIDRKSQETAEKKARRDSGGKRAKMRGDMPKIMIGKRVETSEATGGAQDRLAEKRRDKAREAAASARARIEVLQPLSVALPSTGLPAGRTILSVEDLVGGHDPREPVIDMLSFSISGPERVAIAGPNGSGKTTLLALVSGALSPVSGRVTVTDRRAMLDQHVSVLDPAVSILDNFRRINAGSSDNECRAALARFMFRADAALQVVGTLSGGQMLRAGLACVIGGSLPPELLILDEPTNHLDIGSIEAVEAGLRAYDGALLVVSHDEDFLRAVGVGRRIRLPAN